MGGNRENSSAMTTKFKHAPKAALINSVEIGFILIRGAVMNMKKGDKKAALRIADYVKAIYLL